MNLSVIQRIYFLGIGGIGMSALARYFKKQGAVVSGYDKTPSTLTESLESEGIDIHFDDDLHKVDKNADVFVYTPAIPKSHPAFQLVRNLGKTWYKRSEVLQWITDECKTLAISGTHGKTTTTAILTHIMHDSFGNTAGFVGGVMSNYNSNLITSQNPEYAVVEADEYDKSFLRLNPEIAVVTSLDPDHLDIYGSFDQMKSDYKKFAKNAKRLLVNASLAKDFDIAKTYSAKTEADYTAKNIQVVNGRFEFDVHCAAEWIGKFNTSLPGRHNVENALAAIAINHMLNTDMVAVASALASFQGVHRRFERVFEQGQVRLIDDYAHHPVEISAAISAARELYPKTKITVIFQPHLFSRTRDLEDDFAMSLSEADEVILVPIYPAREEPIDGVSSDHLLKKVSLKTKHLVEKSDLTKAVLSLSPETVLVLGAGDIDRWVNPLANCLKDWINNVE